MTVHCFPVLLLASVLASAPLLAQPATPAAAPVADAADAGQPSDALKGSAAIRAGLTPEIVAKLSAEQITDLLETHDNAEPPAVAIVVPVAFFLFIALVIGASVYAGFRKDRLRHETLRLMIEKGATIPPELLVPQVRRNDLRRGILFVSAGLGLALVLGMNAEGEWTLGALLVLVGLGHLVAWRLEQPKAPVQAAAGAPS